MLVRNFHGQPTGVNNGVSKQEKTKTALRAAAETTAAITGAVVATGTIAAGAKKGFGGLSKLGKLVSERISAAAPELKTKAKGIIDKLSGEAKRQEEAKQAEALKEAQAKAKAAKEKLEAEYQEAMKAKKLEQEKRAQQAKEAIEKRRTEAAEKAKAEAAKKAALAAQKAAEHENYVFLRESGRMLYELVAPIGSLKFKIYRENPNVTFEKLNELTDDAVSKFDFWDFLNKIKKSEPQDVFKKIAERFTKNTNSGGNLSFDELVNFLNDSKTRIDLSRYDLKKSNPISFYRADKELTRYEKYIDEILAELGKVDKNAKEPVDVVLKRAISTVEKNKNAFLEARKAICTAAKESYQKQLAPIKARLKYEESLTSGENPMNLDRKELQELADNLNELLMGESNFTADTPWYKFVDAWKKKYVSGGGSVYNQKAETAILKSFPRFSASENIQKQGEFAHEPLYRFMHIEDIEGFLKQFEKIGGEYAPQKLQSCSKDKYYGEYWGNMFASNYGFTEWSPQYNVKFVIHPKGAVSKAADIGEGKYGALEAIYPADSRFKIVGTLKKKVTPEEIHQHVGEDIKFNDFERYEIHLQEM